MADKARSPGPAYERGVAHLKRGEYPQAIAAFTEAVGLDADAANAFVGRALAYRSIGDDAAAVRDEEAARKLGGPERSAWDRLVRQAYRRWGGDLRNPAWKREDPLGRKAVLLHQWVWQIHNGGLPQWVANGYGEWAADLARAVEEVGTDAVAAIVREVIQILHRWPGARDAMFQMLANPQVVSGEHEELFAALSGCEASYAAGCRSFATDVEAWVERQLAHEI
jgi:tetratricopeptide (TPR) repeat protein